MLVDPANPEQLLSELDKSTGAICLTHHTLAPLPNDFYSRSAKELALMVGNETDSRNYSGALSYLSDRLALHLDQIDQRLLGLMLLELNKARRFGSELMLPNQFKENSAVHSCHCTLLLHELLRQAGFLSADNTCDSNLNALRIDATLMLLVHDMGECWGELSSLPQRVIQSDRAELPLLERRIFRICMFEAARVVANNSGDYQFHARLLEMRQSAGILGNALGASDPEHLKLVIEKYELEQSNISLPAAMYRRIERFTKLWTAIEFAEQLAEKNSALGFRSLFAKCCEHLQGSRHLNRFRKIESTVNLKPPLYLFNPLGTPNLQAFDPDVYLPAIASEICSSYRVIANARYDEPELAGLWKHAVTPEFERIAQVATQSVFLTAIERLRFMRPIVDLTVTGQSPEVNSLILKFAGKTPDHPEYWSLRNQIEELMRKELRWDERRYEIQQGSGRPSPDSELLPIESIERIMALYLKAVLNEYRPLSSAPLVCHANPLPGELRNFGQLSILFEHPLKTFTRPDLELLKQAQNQENAGKNGQVKKFVKNWVRQASLANIKPEQF